MVLVQPVVKLVKKLKNKDFFNRERKTERESLVPFIFYGLEMLFDKKENLAKLNQQIKEKWMEHNTLERGNAVKVFQERL